MVQEPPFLPLTRSGNRYLKRLDHTSDHQAEILGNVVPNEALAQHPGLQLSWYSVCAYAALLELKILPFFRCQLHFLALRQFLQQDFQFFDENLFEILVILEQRVEIILQCWLTSNGVCIYPQFEAGNWKPSTLFMLFRKLQTCHPLNLYPISYCFSIGTDTITPPQNLAICDHCALPNVFLHRTSLKLL